MDGAISEVYIKQEHSEEDGGSTHMKTEEEEILFDDVSEVCIKQEPSEEEPQFFYGTTCKSRWNNVEDNNRKSLKRNEPKSLPSAKKMKVYKYAEQINFLTNCGNSKEDADQYLASSQGNIALTLNTRKVSRKNTVSGPLAQKTTAAALLKYLIEQNKNEVFSSAQPEQHPVDAFLCYIASVLKTLSPFQWHLAKSELFFTVQKFEMAAFTEQQSH